MIPGVARRALLRMLVGAPFAAAAKDILRSGEKLSPADLFESAGAPVDDVFSTEIHEVYDMEADVHDLEARLSSFSRIAVPARYASFKSWSRATKERETRADMLIQTREHIQRRRWFRALRRAIASKSNPRGAR